MIHNALEMLGLKKKEIEVYLELLSLGMQPASVLARDIGMPRSTVQFHAESLVQKGFASKQEMKNVFYYEAVRPEHLSRLLESEKISYLSELEEKKKNLESIIPLLHERNESSLRPHVQIFEGVNGLKMVYEDALSSKEEIRALVNFEDRKKYLPEFFDTFSERRQEKGIKTKAIYPDTAFGREWKERDLFKLRESQLVDPKKYYWIPDVRLYDNKVSIISVREKMSVLIESKDIAHAMKVIFDLAWEGLETREKKSSNIDKT